MVKSLFNTLGHLNAFPLGFFGSFGLTLSSFISEENESSAVFVFVFVVVVVVVCFATFFTSSIPSFHPLNLSIYLLNINNY